jgi:predicted CXXCH cytochrome family protein
MKKLMLIAAVLPAFAFGQIAGTKHDFATNTNAQSGDSQICRYCHIPHGARDQSFIFSHTATTQTYTWGATTQHTRGGTTLQANIATNGSWSAGCLDCHDGSVALGSLYNGVNLAFSGAGVDSGTGALAATNRARITKGGSTNLNGNHPVSVPYPGQSGTFRGQATPSWPTGYAAEYVTVAAGGSVGGGLALAGDYSGGTPVYGVECSTCHNPHGAGFSYLLRDTHVGSGICLDCHIK